MKKLLCFLLVATSLLAQDNTVSKPDGDAGWLLLFDGESLFGWTPESGARWDAKNAVLSQSADGGYLRSDSAFADFALKFDYRPLSPDADCSVFLRAAIDGIPRDTAYQIGLGDTNPAWPAGSIIDTFKADSVHPAPNQWHSVEVTLTDDHITVKLDGRKLADGKNSRSRAGFIDLSCAKPGRMLFRNIKLKPVGVKALFNGTDLSGWKSVGPPPPKKEGILKKVMGGGGKEKEAEWSVADGAMHAQKGTGQLETTVMYDDFMVQLSIRVNSREKSDRPSTAVFFRGDAGQLSSGYEALVQNLPDKNSHTQPGADVTGAIKGLATARKALGGDNEFFTETIAAVGRHIQVWVDGYPVSDFLDTRAENAAPQKGARVTAGTISLMSPDEKANLDFRNIQVAQLPKTLGKGPAQAVAIPPPTPAPPPVTIPSGPATPTEVIPAAPPDPNKPKVQALMAKALNTTDPHQQKNIYGQILELDPSNPMAASGYQQAQQKIEQEQAQQQQVAQLQQQQTQTQEQNQSRGVDARQSAENAFLARDFKTAAAQIALASQLLPGDPQVQELRSRIDSAVQARQRLMFALSGVGALAFLTAIVLFFRSRRGNRQAYLEVISGIDKGKRYNLDQEIIHIGAVAQDGGKKNEIVVQDVERMISRFHCEIHKQDGRFFLIDLGSANGTSVDRRSVRAGKPVRLKAGARVDLAGTWALRLGFGNTKKS